MSYTKLCAICGKPIKESEAYESSHRKKHGVIFVHTNCLKKEGAQNDTAGKRN